MDDIGRLITLAGAREPIPDERFERVRHNVRAHWQQVVVEQKAIKHPRDFKFMAIAASLVLVAGSIMLLWNLSGTPTPRSLASVERIMGDVKILDVAALTNSVITTNTPITTGSNGRLALRMSGGQSLRIDTASHVVVHAPDHVSLQTGAVYIDSSFATEDKPIIVSTAFGTARDIGTQFQVRVTGKLLVIGVRKGLVEVTQSGQQILSINRGSRFELNADGKSEQHALQPDDPDWAWVETITPEFDIEGVSLAQYLRWFALERGVDLVWADSTSEAKAGAALLTGSIAGTRLDEGLLLVKQVAPFEHRLSGDSLWVKVE